MPLSRRLDGVTLQVRVTPKASHNAIGSVTTLGDGTQALTVRVTAVPDKGKANTDVIKLLATSTGVPKSSITILAGSAARTKTVRIAGDADELMERLHDWLHEVT